MPSITSDSMTREDIVSSELSIGGVPTAPEDGRYFTTTEAVTGEPIARVAAASAADARRAVDAAAAAPPEWAGVVPGERRAILLRAAGLGGQYAASKRRHPSRPHRQHLPTYVAGRRRTNIVVSDRGRIPAAVMGQYLAARAQGET